MAPAIPYIMYGVMAAGTALSAYGQIQQGKNQEKIANYNAQIQKRENVETELNARDRLRKLIGRQRTLYAKAGVDLTEGSPFMVLEDTVEQGERDAMRIRRGGKDTVAGMRYEGSAYKSASKINAGSTFLSGLSQMGQTAYARKN
jgi:hypothetical protein